MLAACAVWVAGCGSSGPAVKTSKTGARSGIETITGQLAGKAAALSKTPPIPLRATGVFKDDGATLNLNGKPGKGSVVLKFTNGWLDVTHFKGTMKQHLDAATCVFTVAVVVPYTVTGGTRAYKGASGHGTAHVSFLATAPRHAGGKRKGKCDGSAKAIPVADSAQVMVLLSGPLKLPG